MTDRRTSVALENFVVDSQRVVDRAQWEMAADLQSDVFDWGGTLKTLGATLAHWPGALGEMAITEYQDLRIREFARGDTPRFPGVRVGSLLILGELGSGGQGTTYRAVDYDFSTVTNNDVCRLLAVKFGMEGDRRLHGREAPIMQRLTTAQVFGIAKYHSHGFFQNRPFLTTLLVPGSDLEQHVLAHGTMKCREVAKLTAEVLEAVRGAHAVGILHRDLKPKNVMLGRIRGELRAWVIDWGLGTFLDEDIKDDPLTEHFEQSQAGTLVGTWLWKSPEHLLQSLSIVPASDVYCAALVMYYMYNGRDPFLGSLSNQVSGKMSEFTIEPESGLKTVHTNLQRLFRDMTSQNPNQRPTISECLERLQRLDEPAVPVVLPQPRSLARMPQSLDPPGPTPRSCISDTVTHESAATQLPFPSSSGTPPNRLEPLVAKDDAFLFSNPYAGKLNLTHKLLGWDGLWGRHSENNFLAHITRYWEQLQQLASAQEANSFLELADKCARQDDKEGQLDYLQAAWGLRPWDHELKRTYLEILRSEIKRPAIWLVDPFVIMIARRPAALFSGELRVAAKEAEKQLRESPWSLSAIWAEAQMLDLLSMWSACAETVSMLIASLDPEKGKQRKLCGRLYLIAAAALSKNWELAKSAELMNKAKSLCPGLTEFDEYKTLKQDVYSNLTVKKNIKLNCPK